MPWCEDCAQEFRTNYDLHAHCRDRGDHAYCVSCKRLFVSFNALDQHLQTASVHLYGEDSGPEEYSDDELDFCNKCNRHFVDKESLYKHLAHSSFHNWCFVCSRDFATPTSLNQHSSSRVHSSRDFRCPLCPQTFRVPSAIALHIEAGACHKYSRQDVTAAVQRLPIASTIAINRRIQGPVSTSAAGNTIIVHYSATELAFNGCAYECYICHRIFGTLRSLNAHLDSPAHNTNVFRCPSCRREFKLVSGLIQHLETETCKAARFQQIENYATVLADQLSKLLKL